MRGTVLAVGLLARSVVAARQCRLVLPADLEASPPVPSVGLNTSATATATGTASASSSAPSASATPFTAFNYGHTPIRGVNLGGWFVLEPWITPSIFIWTNNSAVVDEYTLGKLVDNDVALDMLKQHWETWITEVDFKAIAAAGLTHVRIPLGYWSIPTNNSASPYIPGAWPYFLQALTWARAHNVHAIVDLHGAPGSQNGYDNSGQRTGSPQWATSQANVDGALDAIKVLASEAGSMLDGIELLNEAAGFTGGVWPGVIRQYFLDGYTTVREAAGDDVQVVIGDAFEGVDNWENFLNGDNATNVLMDFHEYQIFSDAELSRSEDEHIQYACNTILPNLDGYANGGDGLRTVSGEWSTAVTDCAKWLNGRGVGSRWDGTYGDGNAALGNCTGYTGNYSTFSDDYKSYLRKYWEVQVEVGERVQGWIYWTWKAENADDWSYQKGLEGGWIPQDPTNRLYPDICD
ncbi:glycoside hydrolase family 5 protein [Peniophora sp. CONT]|nr:glycoside hydrolase family 5 protein [Peniophora sp. CONT]